MRYLMSVAYDGTNYQGFQIQSALPSVQGAIVKALQAIDPLIERVLGASRTDKGVHAHDQKVTFDSTCPLTPKKWLHAINCFLPADIRVNSLKRVDPDFHPRHAVREKKYRYLINTGPKDLFGNNYAWQLGRRLDRRKLRIALELFVGRHDFRLFTTDNEKTKRDLVRTIDKITISGGRLISISFIGKSFLRGQLRFLVGAAVDVALGKYPLESIGDRLAGRITTKSTRKAPGCGLYLVKIKY